MSETADSGDQLAVSAPVPPIEATDVAVPSGIGPVDERTGGLQQGGSYLIVGTPGPAKMVAALQFLHAGIARGEPVLLLTNADDEGILGVARAWGLDMDRGWRDGSLQILGFKDDFELRAIRTVEPEEVLEELDLLAGRDLSRIAVDPGSMFLAGGAKSLLGAAFLKWGRNHPATVFATFSVDGAATSLPSSADWLVHATTGRLIIEWRSEELYQITLAKAVPSAGDREETISVQLKPGEGLVTPESWPSRRGRDRAGVDENRLLLISLGGSHASDIETWAVTSFTTDLVTEPFDAVARIQSDSAFGGVLVYAPRTRIREAVQACQALRPLTRAAIVFASDDTVRSTDRIHILEAGADDCLSGGIDFRELDLRIRQAIAAGSKPALQAAREDGSDGDAGSGPIPDGSDGGRVPRDLFNREVTRRAADPVLTFFCLLDVTSGVLTSSDLEEVLAQQVRADEGDLVSGDSGRCAVLLQGARESQLGPFVARLRARLEERAGKKGDPDLAVEILSHPADSDRINALLGISGGLQD
ncbi:MAG: hypothetical protein O7J95_05265 [Planctomycetota bacterium]|nr:hypothetical protein [Planctomycetota bacterium]